LEAAAIKVERPEMRLEVDVHPLAAGSSGLVDGGPHDRGPDPAPLPLGVNRSVHNERVLPAVPSDLHKPEKTSLIEGSHPGERVPPKPVAPLGDAAFVLAEGARMQPIDLGVHNVKPNPYIHRDTLPSTEGRPDQIVAGTVTI
jgi:hypothetical protein